MSTMWERTARQITADALDDLAGHKKLQSPEGQRFLEKLRDKYHNENTEPLVPWLAREFRKGRISLGPNDDRDLGAHPFLWWQEPNAGAWTDPDTGLKSFRNVLRPEAVNHWADWLKQPDRRKVPLEQLQVHDLPGEIERYEHEKAKRLQDEGVEEGRHHGEVVHTWPDGWTVQKLPHGKALDFEAWNMRGDPDPRDGAHPHGAPICVNWPQYQRQVEGGHTLIYSLRDPRGNPHVTTEITPHDDGDRPRYEPFTPEDLERAFTEDPNARHLNDDTKHRLREFFAQGSVEEQRGAGVDPDLWSLAWEIETGNRRRTPPSPENGEIVQIQGKGNSVAKPEYQARMKDWFQTFPEETRPNWDIPDGDIEHIGGIYPEAETWNNYLGYQQIGEPDADHDGGGQGGYGPHGDYGLATPHRAINYDATVDSLLRARHHGEWRDSEHQHHDDDEVAALYREALRRGEIPQLADAATHHDEQAMEDFSRLEDMNYDYVGGQYPGESWDEDPERWRDEYYQRNHAPVEEDYETPEEQEQALEAIWRDQHESYEFAQNELYESHAPSQLATALREKLEPHAYPPDATNSGFSYRNEPRWPTVIEHLRPNTEQVPARELPPGSFYANNAGGVNKLDPESKYGLPQASLIPTHIHIPGEDMPQRAAKVTGEKPFRHLWAFSPQSGQVHLYNEDQHHPAEAPTHDSIAADLGEVGLHHGYAYTIPGGWRILDYHHQPVADPYVLRNVVEGLRKRAVDSPSVFIS